MTERPVVESSELDYSQKMFSHSSYNYIPVMPNTFGAPINIGVSSTPVTLNIPAEVMNLGEAILNYKVKLPAPDANNYTWCHTQALPGLDHIQYFASNNMYVVDIQNLSNYNDICIKKETSREDFLSLDESTGVSQSNSVVNLAPALRNANIMCDNIANRPANPSSINYTEPGYFKVSNAEIILNVSFKLKLIKNTWFSCAKEMYCPQTTYLKLYFGPISKVCYNSTSNASPSAGVKSQYSKVATIEGLKLMLPVESNENIRRMLMAKVQSAGLSFVIPYPVSYKNSNTGGAQTISIEFNVGLGATLQKVIHAVYNNQENLDTAFDHSNCITVAGVKDSHNNQKIYSYYTTLNGARQQNLTLDCTESGPYLDYLQNRDQIEGSILSNRDVYQYNWFHCDNYAGFDSKQDQNNEGNLISGVPMLNSNLTWAFNGISTRDVQDATKFFHYTYAIFSKKMTIDPTGTITVM